MINPRVKGAQAPPSRFQRAQVFVALAFLVLAARLWHLQVYSGELYFKKSADNFVKELELPATRGQILDRHGRVLADNRPSYNVYITPRFFTGDAMQKLARDLRLDDADVDALRAKIQARRGLDRFRQLLAFEDIPRDRLAQLESDGLELPGVSFEAAVHRQYPHGTLGAHTLGYLNQITTEELNSRRELGYAAGDYVGRSGLERQWESFLRGKSGVERIVVDAKGQRKVDVDVRDFLAGPQRIEPEPGHDLVTTLDLDVMRVTEEALKKYHSGAVAVVEVETGRVLALASWPEVDPNILTGRLSFAEAEALDKDPWRPRLDKTVRENYFPGSTFKVVPMLAALEDGLVDPDDTIKCTGAMRFGKRWFHCVEPHGVVNLHRSIVESCNVYYYGLGDRVGLDRIARTAHDLGFGAPTGLGLNGEVPGFIPTMAWYEKHGGYQKGIALNTAIGQGSVKVTVLQLAMAYAAIANGGRLYVPQIVEKILTPSGKVVQAFEPRLRRQLAATPQMLERTRRALLGAVNDPKGTSYSARVPGLDVAGKTGTAQVRNRRVRDNEGTPLADHAWFASFAPAQKPEYAVVVLIEHGGFGSKSATPVAMEIYRSILGKSLAVVEKVQGRRKR